jgi:hypothetical protein
MLKFDLDHDIYLIIKRNVFWGLCHGVTPVLWTQTQISAVSPLASSLCRTTTAHHDAAVGCWGAPVCTDHFRSVTVSHCHSFWRKTAGASTFQIRDNKYRRLSQSAPSINLLLESRCICRRTGLLALPISRMPAHDTVTNREVPGFNRGFGLVATRESMWTLFLGVISWALVTNLLLASFQVEYISIQKIGSTVQEHNLILLAGGH